MRLALPLLLAALIGLTLAGPSPAPARPAPRCRVQVDAVPTRVTGVFHVVMTVRSGCPEGGFARVRVQAGQVYPWRTITPTRGTVFHGIPWWYTGGWEAASGRVWPLALDLAPPWRQP